MSRKRWSLLPIAALVAVLCLRLAALAQENKKPPAGENLATADADVIDATAAVEKGMPAAPANRAEAWPVKDLTPPDLGPLQITVYQGEQALVRQRRTLQLRVGDNLVDIDGVPRKLEPRSVRLRPLRDPAAFTVLEQDAQAPALSSNLLLSTAIGKPVHLRDGRYTIEGTLLAVEEKGVIIAAGDEIHVHPEGEVIVTSPSGPPRSTPKLSWTLQSKEAGEVEAELSYLTAGLTWAADYALTTSDNDRLVSFEGWLDLTNDSGADLSDAGVLFATTAASAAVTRGGPPQRYFLPRKIALPNGGVKRFALVQAPAVRSAVRYVATLAPGGPAAVRLAAELLNTASAGLGVPLPPGPVRLYAPDRVGRLEFRGEQKLAATAAEGALRFDLGPADDVQVKVADTPLPADGSGRPGLRRVVRLRNLRTEEAAVRVVEQRPGSWQVANASQAFATPSNGAASSDIVVPANGAAELRYELRLASTPKAAVP